MANRYIFGSIPTARYMVKTMVYNYVRKETKRLAKKHFGCNIKVVFFKFENTTDEGTTVGYCNKTFNTIGYFKPFILENSDNMRVINALIAHEVGHLLSDEHDDVHAQFCRTMGYNTDPSKEMIE